MRYCRVSCASTIEFPFHESSRLLKASWLSAAVCGMMVGCSGLPNPMSLESVGSPTPAAPVVAATSPEPSIPRQSVDLKVCDVTARGLVSVGALNAEAIAAWFNRATSDGDPFTAPMLEEIAAASSSAQSLGDMKLSSATIETLAAFDVSKPDEIAKLDRLRFKDSNKAFDICRNEIAAALQARGWTVLRAEVKNQPNATQLLLNGALVGPIERSEKPAWKRFVVNPPCERHDARVFATLTVELPSPSTGAPPVRWSKDILLERGGETRVAVDVGEAPLPSIEIAPKSPLSPAAIYAGDSVTLTCEGGGADTVWFAFGEAEQLSSQNYVVAPHSNDVFAGLPAWFRLRLRAESLSDGRSNLLEGASTPSMVLGRGPSISWQPQFESPNVRLGALVRNPSGFWGFAERAIAVVDLRPGVWLMPALPVSEASAAEAKSAAEAVGTSPINIYRTHRVLGALTYLAKVGAPVAFDMRSDEYRDACLPLDSVTVDFGDGSTPLQVAAGDAPRAQLTHAYTAPGVYRVAVRSIDSMGFARSHGTTIAVAADAPEPPRTAASFPRGPTVRIRLSASAAQSTFDLFEQASRQFAHGIVAATAPYWAGRKMALSHIHDQKDQHLLDLMDSLIVSELLQHEAQLFEREPVFQSVVDARGFVNASSHSVPDQGGLISESIRNSVAAGKQDHVETSLETIHLLGEARNPDVEVVLDYKLKRAEVEVVPAGSMLLRTARLYGFVRVHERESMRILYSGAVQIDIPTTVVATEGSSRGSAWDAYPEGFMIKMRQNDPAIGSVKASVQPVSSEVEKNREQGAAPAAPADRVPAVAPAVKQVPSVGGFGDLLRGAIGK
jgi:hypothetical protein